MLVQRIKHAFESLGSFHYDNPEDISWKRYFTDHLIEVFEEMNGEHLPHNLNSQLILLTTVSEIEIAEKDERHVDGTCLIQKKGSGLEGQFEESLYSYFTMVCMPTGWLINSVEFEPVESKKSP